MQRSSLLHYFIFYLFVKNHVQVIVLAACLVVTIVLLEWFIIMLQHGKSKDVKNLCFYHITLFCIICVSSYKGFNYSDYRIFN